jgi:hypothetical protein
MFSARLTHPRLIPARFHLLGCMDRFTDDKVSCSIFLDQHHFTLISVHSHATRYNNLQDAAQQDFVRLEYAQALRLSKHIVPVYKV